MNEPTVKSLDVELLTELDGIEGSHVTAHRLENENSDLIPYISTKATSQFWLGSK